MNTIRDKKHGLTGVVSYKDGTSKEKMRSDEMANFLVCCGFFEDESDAVKRERVLGKLDFLVKQFVIKVGIKSGMSKSESEKCGGKIFTYGSYRLGVHSKGADIDTLCIVPRHVNREDFFTIFYEILEEINEIKNLSKVEGAYVPLIKMEFDGIPIDLVFARMTLAAIDDNISLLKTSLLKGMDEKCIMSLNGNRVVDEILGLVPNTHTFHAALRCVKYWANKRCIYGHLYGYPGGIAYALCVARICQMFPNETAFGIVREFFDVFSKWKWPAPVLLKEVENFNYNLKVWDPKIHPSDKFHRMPIITPAYPSMCSTHNIIASTQTRVTEELVKGSQVLNEDLPTEELLKKLFLPTDFFQRYKHFLVVISYGGEITHSTWKGLVESRLRHLALKLEVLENITSAPIFPHSYDIETSLDTISLISKIVNTNKKFLTVNKKEEKIKYTVNFLALDFSDVKQMLNNKKVFIDLPIKEFKEMLILNDKCENDCGMEIGTAKRKDIKDFFMQYKNINKRNT